MVDRLCILLYFLSELAVPWCVEATSIEFVGIGPGLPVVVWPLQHLEGSHKVKGQVSHVSR